jgi:hypothetical protein
VRSSPLTSTVMGSRCPCASRSQAYSSVAASNSMQARAKPSLRSSARSPAACSGGMYMGVPITRPSVVRASSSAGSRKLARPKSRMITRASGVIITLAGFRSRCTTPCACA